MFSWGGGGRQCLVLRGTRVPPSCKWEPVKRGRLPVPGGMRRPPGTGRLPSSYCSSCLVDKAMIFIIQIVIFIITKPIPPGPGRFLSRWPTFCHHFINDWLLSSLSSTMYSELREGFQIFKVDITAITPVHTIVPIEIPVALQ